jgi:hypothetical protein
MCITLSRQNNVADFLIPRTRCHQERFRRLLTAWEDVPTARVALMGTVIHFLAAGDSLYSSCCVRCVDQDSNHLRVYVGGLPSRGIPATLSASVAACDLPWVMTSRSCS